MVKRSVEATEETEVTTTRTVRRRRKVKVEETVLPLPPAAGGWEPQHMTVITPADLRNQRTGQVRRALEFLAVRAHGEPLSDRVTVQEAAIILRAGPGASPLEAIHGRVL